MPVELNQLLWNQLRTVNREVNLHTYKADLKRYLQEDFWTRIDENGGDCEDYALEKRKRLLDLGWPLSCLKLCVCRVEGGGHCVLTVDTDRGTYVLDNLLYNVTPWEQLSYDWIMRQNGQAWVHID